MYQYAILHSMKMAGWKEDKFKDFWKEIITACPRNGFAVILSQDEPSRYTKNPELKKSRRSRRWDRVNP